MKLTRHIAAVPRAGAIALIALVCSCNRESRLEGRYTAQNAMFDLEFKDGHKANMISGLGGVTIEFDYEVNGKEVKLKFPDATVIATIGDDGCLNLGDMGGRLCKEKVASSGFLKRVVAREPRLEGRYTSQQGLLDLEFKDTNKVNQITLFGTTEIDYEVSGREVKLKAPTGTMVGTIGDDGCLNFGGFYGSICKKEIASKGTPATSERRYSNQYFDLEFKDSHKATFTEKENGRTAEIDYEINGNKIKLEQPNGTVIASVIDGGCLHFEETQKIAWGPFDGRASMCRQNASPDLSNSYVAAMKSDLRNVATYEEQHAVDHGGAYFSGTATAAASLQGFAASQNVTVVATSLAGPPPSWSAMATHAQSTRICNMTNGVITCI